MSFIIDKRNYIILIIIVFLCFDIFFPRNKVFMESFENDYGNFTIVIYDKVDYKKVHSKISNICNNYNIDYKNDVLDYLRQHYDINLKTHDFINAFIAYRIKNYLDNLKVKKYIINQDGNIIAGQKYGSEKYTIGIISPGDNKLLKTASLENSSMSTLNKKNGRYDSIVVISSNNITSTLLSNFLYFLSVDDGKTLAKKYSCDVLWYFENEIVMTDNFKKYVN